MCRRISPESSRRSSIRLIDYLSPGCDALALHVFGTYTGSGALEIYAVVGLGMVHADRVAARRWVFKPRYGLSAFTMAMMVLMKPRPVVITGK
jgi:hypothetical protein